MATLALRVLPGVLASLLLVGPVVAAPVPHHDRRHPARHLVAETRRSGHVQRIHSAAIRLRHRIGQAMLAAQHPAVAVPAGLIRTAAFVDDGLAVPQPPRNRPPGPQNHWVQTGTASWYGGREWQGRMTSSGARYDENQLTAAHAGLPLGTRVRVTLAHTTRSVVVVVTDRPGTRRRIIDLSRAAAATLGILDAGVATVTLTSD